MQERNYSDGEFNYWGGDEPYPGDWENDGLWGTHLEWPAYGLHAKPESPMTSAEKSESRPSRGISDRSY